MSSTKQNIRRRNVAKKSSPKKSSPDVDQKTPPQGARHKLSRSNQWRSLFRGWGGAVRNACGVALALALALAAVFFAFVRDENRESVPQISGGDDFDALVVGAGLSGMVFADLLSRLKGLRVLVIEKRDHIGGNCYDEMDGDSGILMNRYGAHLFHTNNTMVWDYVHRFSEWEPFEHRVVGKVDKKLVPIPVNIETVNLLTESKVKSVAEMAQWLEDNQLKLDREPANSEEAAKQRVGARLFAKIFEEYTKKQWARPAQELNASVLQRIPVIETYDDRYFPADRFQALPSRGYTEWINTSFTNENITVQLDTDYFTSWHSKVRDGSAPFSKVFFTGPIDHFFEGDPDVDLDPLEYRSISFEREFIANTPFYQMAGQVNYPQFDDGNFTRIIEYKHFLKRTLKQALYPHTVIFKEFSTDDGEPYYPVADSRNQELFAKYNELAERWSKDRDGIVHFVGRLANYKYFNMDAAILNALTEYAKLYNVSMDELHREIKANSPSSTGSVPSNRCPFEISFALQTDGEQIPPKVQELCAHPFYQRHRERAQFQIYRTSPSAKSQDGYDWDSYQRFATKLKEMGCTLGPSDGTDLGIDPNRRFYDNLFVKTLPADGRESECWINHFVIAPLSDANVFLRGDIGADIGDIIEALSEMERSLWINSSWCGTRPNPKNFEDPNVLKHGFANFHFQSFSISKMHRNDDNGTLCELLRRIEPDRELSDAECSAAALSEGGEFVASNVAIVRMLQKHRTFLWEIYSRIRSQTNADSLALTLQMRRLWFPLFRGFEALTPSQFNWEKILSAFSPKAGTIDVADIKWWPGQQNVSLHCPRGGTANGDAVELIDTKQSGMWRPVQFGYEIMGIIPWHFALCKNKGVALRTHSVEGMEPYYFWSPRHRAVPGLNHSANFFLPNGNPLKRANPHLPLTAFPDATEWRMPNFKAMFSNQLFVFENDRKSVLISNKFNREWGGPAVNFFAVDVLADLFRLYLDRGYNVIYKRPVSNVLLNDENTQSQELKDHELIRSRFGGQVLRYSEVVDRVQEAVDFNLTGTWMNLIQLQIMANVDEFVSVQGGNAVLSSLFCREHFILHHKGHEYGVGDFSFYPRLNSNNVCTLRVYTDEKVMLRDLKREKQERSVGKQCKGCTPEQCTCSYIDT